MRKAQAGLGREGQAGVYRIRLHKNPRNAEAKEIRDKKTKQTTPLWVIRGGVFL